MRNDALDEVDDVPSLTTDVLDHDYGPGRGGPGRESPGRDGREPYPPVGRPARARGAGTGPLWALVVALVIALGALGGWSYQQMSLMSQQLVATQESFARISEEAAGRIQAISGKVVATESNVTSGSEALRLRVKQLEARLDELDTRQRGATGAQDGVDKRLEQFGAELKALQDTSGQLAERMKTLNEQLDAKAQAVQAVQAQVDTQLKGLLAEVAALKKQGDSSQAVARLEQDLLVLRSELDARAAPAAGNTAEFDAFRGQVTRNISALQSQVQNLQRQLNGR